MRHRKSRLLLLLVALAAFAQAPHPSVTLTWSWSQGTGDPATGFHVQRSSVAGGPYTTVATTPVAVKTYLDTSVLVGSTYYYVVTAYNPAGDGVPSAEVTCVIPFQIPSQVTGVSAVAK